MVEIKRMNLKELRDTLNEIKDEKYLEDTSIAFDRNITDTSNNNFGMITLFGRHWENEIDFMDKKQTKAEKEIFRRFVDFLNKDLKQARIGENEKGYDEEYNIEGDW